MATTTTAMLTQFLNEVLIIGLRVAGRSWYVLACAVYVQALMKPSEPLAVAVQRVRHFMNPRGPETSSTNPGAGAAAAAGQGQQQHAAAVNDDIVITDEEEDVVVGNRCVLWGCCGGVCPLGVFWKGMSFGGVVKGSVVWGRGPVCIRVENTLLHRLHCTPEGRKRAAPTQGQEGSSMQQRPLMTLSSLMMKTWWSAAGVRGWCTVPWGCH